VHTSLLLEALDGDLDALSERFVLIIHPALFFSFRWRDGRLDEGLLEASWLLHVLGRAIRIHLLLLWMERDWMYSRLASTGIEGDIVFFLAKVFVE
jgi:hypothetical protein